MGLFGGLPVHLAFDLLSVLAAGGMTWVWAPRSPGMTQGAPGGTGDPGHPLAYTGGGGAPTLDGAEPKIGAIVAPIATPIALQTPRRPGLDPGPRPQAGTAPLSARIGPVGGEGYLSALSLGILLGSYLLGTANLWLSGVPAVGRSILGALAGGIVGVELYKASKGIKGSTGGLFVPTFCTLVIVGRIGCALSGLEDHTYGTPTTLPWGHDFGDGIPRHPVAAYESLAMAAYLVTAWVLRKRPLFAAHGFHLMVGFYALQRFGLEFLKPYAALLGPLNLFHMTCAALFAYALVMVRA